MQGNKAAKFLKIVAIIAGVALVIGFIVFAKGALGQIKNQNAELSKKAEAYDNDKSKKEQFKDILNPKEDEQKTTEEALHLGSCVILFTDPSKVIIDAMIPSLDLYEQKAVVALPLDYQASNDVLSIDELKALTKKGWELVLRVSDEDTKDEDKIVEAYKFYTGKKLPICEELYSIDRRSIGEKIMVQGNMNDYAKIRLDEAIAKNQAYSLAIGTLNLDDHFESDNLDAMLKLLQQYELAGTVEITTVTGALERLALAEAAGVLDENFGQFEVSK